MRIPLLVSIVLGGCVGGIESVGGDDGGGGGEEARAIFEADVFPTLLAKCGSCHSAGGVASVFVGANATAGYDLMMVSAAAGNLTRAGAPVFSKVVPGPHQGQTYTAEEQADFDRWFASEQGGGGGGDPSTTTAQLIREWSGCVTLADVETTGFATAWADKAAGGGTCALCHSGGLNGFYANSDPTLMHTAITTNTYFLGTFWSADVSVPAAARMVPNFTRFTTVGEGTGGLYPTHPRYDTSATDPAYQALDTLTALAQQRKANGTCGPPVLP